MVASGQHADLDYVCAFGRATKARSVQSLGNLRVDGGYANKELDIYGSNSLRRGKESHQHQSSF